MPKQQIKITESDSLYDDLEEMPIEALLSSINQEDKKVADAVQKVLPKITPLVEKASTVLKNNGRIFYIGAGTSGRLGVLDASECPPTFGVPNDRVIGLIAGGDHAIRNSVENAEDDTSQAWKDLKAHNINNKDIVIGISASGTTPYVVGGLKDCKKNNIPTGSISNNTHTAISAIADYPIEVVVGPEFVTGSTRMKSGTAQKMILNMISTASMIVLGKVKGNKMIELRPLNEKLQERGSRIIAEKLNIDLDTAQTLYDKYQSVRKAIENYRS